MTNSLTLPTTYVSERGAATAEYAIATVAAAGFAERTNPREARNQWNQLLEPLAVNRAVLALADELIHLLRAVAVAGVNQHGLDDHQRPAIVLNRCRQDGIKF